MFVKILWILADTKPNVCSQKLTIQGSTKGPNTAVGLRISKHVHYGESESLDFRVKATGVCVNEGRKYLPEVDELFYLCWFCSFVVGYPYFGILIFLVWLSFIISFTFQFLLFQVLHV